MSESVAPALLRVVRGNPSDEDVAALTAVLLARASARATDEAKPVRSEWSRGAGVRRPLPAPGPGAWRASGWPR